MEESSDRFHKIYIFFLNLLNILLKSIKPVLVPRKYICNLLEADVKVGKIEIYSFPLEKALSCHFTSINGFEFHPESKTFLK